MGVSYWLLVTRYSYFTLRQGFGWQAPAPVARSATPPATGIPPTQTGFARGPDSTHATRRAGPGGGGHWRALVTGICCPRYGRWITDHPALRAPLHRGELYSATIRAKFPSAEGCRRSRRGGLSRVTSNELRVTKKNGAGPRFFLL